jgi:hypothetical protein
MVLTAYFVISPVIGLSCHRRQRDASDITSVRCEASSPVMRGHHHRLDISVEMSGPHDFAVREQRPSSCAPPHPSHPALNVRDDAYAPHRGGTAREIELILANREADYF